MKRFFVSITVFALLAFGITAAVAAEVNDGGVEAVREGQETPAPAPAKKQNAASVLKQLCKQKKWREGWDDERKRAFVVEIADFDCKDPASDESFFVKREMAAKKAVLSAKVTFIQTINQDMSAQDALDMPGTDLNKKLHPDLVAIEQDIAKTAEKIAEASAGVDDALAKEARQLSVEGKLTTSAQDVIEALIQRIGGSSSIGQAEAQVAEKVKAAQAELEAQKKRYDELLAKAEEIKETIVATQTSSVESMAKMPLFGATVIMQTESWDQASGKYQVAVLLSWSAELERTARAMVTGEDLRAKPSSTAQSVHDWLDKQDLATMMGPRQYVDNEGNRWYLGISARLYSDDMSSVNRRKRKNIVELFAQQMAAFSLFADVESYKQAQTAIETREVGNETKDIVAEDSAEKLTQAFANRKIRGLQRLAEEEVVHPMTGQQILVAVYGVNAGAAKSALEVERINVATAIQANRYQTVERGRDAANAKAIEDSKNRAEDFQKGLNEQSGKINNELEKREQEQRQKSIRIMGNGANGNTNAPAKSQGGAFGGDVDVEDNF